MRVFDSIVYAGVRASISSVLVIVLITAVQAQVMTSGSYQINSDSVNFGGGLSTSSSFSLESTMGEVGTGDATSTNFQLRAGYQQMQEVYVSLSDLTDVVMSPSLGLAGGVSNGSTSFSVVTDSRAGYRVTLEASNSPAMQSPNGTIGNYIPGGAEPDFSFSTGITQAHFGVSPQGPDIALRYRDNGALCGIGSLDTAAACWDTVSTTPIEIIRGTSANHPAGATSTLLFRVGLGANVNVPAGSYVATTTITAIPL